MIDRGSALLLSGLLAVLGPGLGDAGAQDTTGAVPGTVLARFDNARALAVDPRGRLYVADAARDVVSVLGPGGRQKMVLGGSGTRAGEFDTPSDVDPSNGQVILVADAYNGRVQRFSEEGVSNSPARVPDPPSTIFCRPPGPSTETTSRAASAT